MQARDSYRTICASDPKDIEDCLGLVGTQDRVARIHIRQGKLDEAISEYQKGLALSEPLSVGNAPNLEALYAVVNVYYGLGEVYAAVAVKASTRQQQTQYWKQALVWYEKSRIAFRRIPEWRPITPDEFDSRSLKQIEAQMSLCQSAIRRVAASQQTAAAFQY